MDKHIFIAHAHQDEVIANLVYEGLRANDFKPWLYKHDQLVGIKWQEGIEEAITRSSHIVVLLSPFSCKSDVVEAEIHSARHHKKPLLPLLINDCSVLPLPRAYHVEDARSPHGKGLGNLERLYYRLRQDQKDAEESTHTRGTVLALLEQQKALFDQLASTPTLLQPRSSSRSSTLDSRRVEEWQDTLVNEANKVNGAEAVIAIVGNLHSGKTTLINAIVGTDVLPIDWHPMTSIPTRVRHIHGLKRPEMHVRRMEPIVNFVNRLHNEVVSLKREGRLDDIELYNQAKGRAAIDRLLSWRLGDDRIPQTYEGLADIHGFLRILNC